MGDPIDLLKPLPAVPDEGHKRRVLSATITELRRRRRGRAGSLAALVGGVAAAVLLFAALPVPHAEQARPAPDPVVPVYSCAEEIEWRALERPEESSRLYVQAGDRYLEEDDPAGAVRSYGGALDAATAAEREVSLDDSWLLMAIKLARKKEDER